MEFQQWAKEVQEIARQAGSIILDVYHSSGDWGLQTKADDSPLTRADLLSNAFICNALESLNPAYPIVSEENTEASWELRKSFDYWWVVDPLDGTKEFLARNGEFSVNIALMKGAYPVMGVLYAPFFDEMYWAIEGQGAYLMSDGAPKRLEALSFQLSDQGLTILCSRSHLDADTQKYVDKLSSPKLQPVGSALKMARMAAGQGHLYPRLSPVHEWDIAAGQIILEEAGGAVLDYPGGHRLAYQTPHLKLPAFIASGKLSNKR